MVGLAIKWRLLHLFNLPFTGPWGPILQGSKGPIPRYQATTRLDRLLDAVFSPHGLASSGRPRSSVSSRLFGSVVGFGGLVDTQEFWSCNMLVSCKSG